MKKKKIKKSVVKEKTKLLVLIILSTVILFIVIVILAEFVIPAALAKKEYKKITRGGIDYFCEKYNVKENDIEIIRNYFYGEHKSCILSCWENEMIVRYNNEEYTITYNIDEDYYTDEKNLKE